MKYKDFMNKVRYWDNIIARWMLRHFYIIFFQIVLVVIFVLWFVSVIRTIDVSYQVSNGNVVENILYNQSIHSLIIIFLMLLNSFWMLYIFNTLVRVSYGIKDLNYNINKLRYRDRPQPPRENQNNTS